MLKKIPVENIYLIIALCFGFILVFLLPPFQSPDEDSHFKKAYLVSVGDFYPEDNGSNVGNYLPSNIPTYISIKQGFIGNRDKKYSYSSSVLDDQTLVASSDKVFNNYSTLTINPLIYSVPALGIIASKVISFIIGLPTTITNMLYGARLFSLIVSCLIVFFAIKISPKFKKSMMALALMPMTLALFSAVTYDSLLISLTFLLFGIASKYIFDDEVKVIENKDIWLVMLIVFVYLNVKYIYLFNLIILLFIPKSKYAFSKKDFFKRYGICLLTLVGIYLITKLPNYFVNTSKYKTGSNLVLQQKNYVLNHPFNYIGIYLSNLFGSRFFYISSFVGMLGLLDTFLPIFVVIGYLVYLLLVILVDGSQCDMKINAMKRVLSVIIPFGIISLAFLGMYIYWTPSVVGVKAQTISGVQGRYFIPALCLLPFFFINKFKLNNLKKFFNSYYPIVNVVVLTVTVLVVLLRYWI